MATCIAAVGNWAYGANDSNGLANDTALPTLRGTKQTSKARQECEAPLHLMCWLPCTTLLFGVVVPWQAQATGNRSKWTLLLLLLRCLPLHYSWRWWRRWLGCHRRRRSCCVCHCCVRLATTQTPQLVSSFWWCCAGDAVMTANSGQSGRCTSSCKEKLQRCGAAGGRGRGSSKRVNQTPHGGEMGVCCSFDFLLDCWVCVSVGVIQKF